MPDITVESHNNVAVVRLTKGITNAICPKLVAEFAGALNDIRGEYQALAVAGGDKFFSIGLDLPRLLKLDRVEMSSFWRSFDDVLLTLFTLPIPTAAIINGHATAGGTIIALTADFRFVRPGRCLMGLNEIQLGLPVPYLADLILRQILGERSATDMLYSGRLLEQDEAEQVGLVDEILPEDDLENQVLDKLAHMASFESAAFELIKESRTEVVCEMFERNYKRKYDRFLDCWFDPAAQERLYRAAEKY